MKEVLKRLEAQENLRIVENLNMQTLPKGLQEMLGYSMGL